MSTTRKEQIRIKVGAELDTTENQITQAFTTLNSLQTRLLKVKDLMVAKPLLFDADDIAEVTELVTQITSKYTP